MITTFGATATGGTNPVIAVDLGGASTGVAGDYTITFTASNDEGMTDVKTGTLTIEPSALRSMTKSELVDLANEKGIDSNGTKEELINRLSEA